jgi:hypothetical protein
MRPYQVGDIVKHVKIGRARIARITEGTYRLEPLPGESFGLHTGREFYNASFGFFVLLTPQEPRSITEPPPRHGPYMPRAKALP